MEKKNAGEYFLTNQNIVEFTNPKTMNFTPQKPNPKSLIFLFKKS